MGRSAVSSSHYLHGTDPDEQRRLARLNGLLNVRCLQELALRGGERILDVGSGLGQFTRAMARAALATAAAGGTAAGVEPRAVALERSEDQYREARRLAQLAGEEQLVDWRRGDATQLPLRSDEWGTFDLAHTRFLLEHVTDPGAVVRAMVRAVRPGGRVVLADDGHDVLRLWPAVPLFERLWTAYVHSYERVGNDPYIGHKLVALLRDGGAEPVRNTWLFFGGCAGERELFTAYVENIVAILVGVRTLLLDQELIDADGFAAGLSAFRGWGQLPDAALWYAISWAEGRVAPCATVG